MKTIAVSESAYERLSVWKTSERDTFSKVIERMVPPKGTFDAALEAAKQLPTLNEEQERGLVKFYEKNRSSVESTWK